jgi:hypothetical protein
MKLGLKILFLLVFLLALVVLTAASHRGVQAQSDAPPKSVVMPVG